MTLKKIYKCIFYIKKKNDIFNIELVFYLFIFTPTPLFKSFDLVKKSKHFFEVFYSYQGCFENTVKNYVIKLFIIIKYLNELK